MVDVAVVGLGWWGTKLAQMIGSSARLRVVRGVDPDPAAAQRGFPFPVAGELDAALADPAVEAVVLATPHSLHDAQIAAAAQAGKHVFCEKPLSLTRAGAEASVALMRERGLVLGIGHERRWEPPIVRMLDAARSGKLGILLQLEANFSHDKFVSLDGANWRLSSANAPAGGMTATGIHLFDLATALFGEGETAFANAATLASRIPNGDSACALVRYRNGCTAYVSAMLATPFISRVALYGSAGWIEVRDKAHVEAPDGWFFTQCLGTAPPATVEIPPAAPVLANLEAFAEAVRGGAPYPITPAEMVANTAVMEAIFASAASGKTQLVAA